MWDEITYPKLQRFHRWSLWMEKLFHLTLYNGCIYLSMLELKLNHVSMINTCFTQCETDGIADRCLDPDEALGVYLLGSAIDVTASHPCS